jgi:putative N6-adenine-specific DNA methylase
MCGSGTFPIEAALLAANAAPGLGRRFAFERWPDFDAKLWSVLQDEARGALDRTVEVSIEGADRHPGALGLARKGADAAGVSSLVRFTEADARAFVPRARPSVVVVNPPYGVRLGADEELDDSWRALGNFLHKECKGATAWVLSGNKDLTRYLGLRTSRRIPVMNGPIECRWLRYELHPAT